MAEKWQAPHGLLGVQERHDVLVHAFHRVIKTIRVKAEACETEWDVTRLESRMDALINEANLNVKMFE